MVSFVCGNCQDVLKKNKVDSHCMRRCRDAWEFTCIDCNRTFEGYEYKTHNNCITEEEKYCGKFSKVKKSDNLILKNNLVGNKEELQILIKNTLRRLGAINWKRLRDESIREYQKRKNLDINSLEYKRLKWELLASIPLEYTTKKSNIVALN
ncbi:zinc finger, C2H2, LYAR-type protein [Cryptosporidium felis]|nr:zinc finger, C2H2, LYAR-type protein [Cryptosporidium felis]